MAQITLQINGQDRTLKAEALNDLQRQYYEAALLHSAWLSYNPLADFKDKITNLTPELQAAALQGFCSTLRLDTVPAVVLLDAVAWPENVQLLFSLVTDCADKLDNPADALVTLYPYLQKKEVADEIVCGSLAEVNALRAEAGKAPVGK